MRYRGRYHFPELRRGAETASAVVIFIAVVISVAVVVAIAVGVVIGVAIYRTHAGGILVAVIVRYHSRVRRNATAVRVGWNVRVRLNHALTRRTTRIAIVSIRYIGVVMGAAATESCSAD